MVFRKKQEKSFKASVVTTLVIVTLLILSGPLAEAVFVTISGLQTTQYAQGSLVNFMVSINITAPSAYVPMANISVNVTGPTNINGTFALDDGTLISGNPIINVTAVDPPRPNERGRGDGFDNETGENYTFGYGYGYGYGYGAGGPNVTFTYNVSINTTSLLVGSYNVIASINTGDANKQSFDSAPATFTIIKVVVIKLDLDSNNRTTNTSTATSPAGNVIITIPNGTRALDKDGNPLTEITISSPTSLPANASAALSANDRVIGELVDLVPEGATFDPAIKIRFNYTDAELTAAGVSEDNLKSEFFNKSTNSWEELEQVELNKTQNYEIENITHFSTFALIGTAAAAGGGVVSGAGSGSGGVISSEDPANVGGHETKDVELRADQPIKVSFNEDIHWVYEMEITGKENELTAVRIELLKGKPKKATEIGTQYINIFAGTKRIKESVIRFRVQNSWIASEGILSSDDVRIYWWDGSKWTELETKVVTKDATYTYFEVKTFSLSSFAISGLKPAVTPTPAVTAPGITPTPEITPETPVPPGVAPPTSLAIIIGVFVLIAVVIVLYLKRKEILKK